MIQDTITLTLCEHGEITLIAVEWPVIAEALRCEEDTTRRIRVRQHAYGQRIVYGVSYPDNAKAGYIVPTTAGDETTICAIRRVGEALGDSALADACIADLLTGEV